MSAKLNRLGVASVLIIAAAACDFRVTNPGPVDDSFLGRVEAHQAIANGSARYVFDALNESSYTTSAVTRELFPAGSTSSFGISNFQQAGRLLYDDEHVYDPWFSAQRARYIGETGFDRMAATLAEDANKAKYPNGVTGYKPAVEAALWAAYANRLLGENYCEVAFDGGAIEPRVNALKRAETWFTKAIDAAGTATALATQKTAAYAGRASVRVHMGDWTGALADAALVPTTFTFYALYEESEQGFYNRIYFSTANQPYRAVTVWNTKYVDYYNATKDPRVPWSYDGKTLGDAAVLLVGNVRVPFYLELKFPARGSDILLSSGREMRLIEAEKMLKDGNIAGALAIINTRRAALSPAPPPVTAATINEAWTVFKAERGIELWLEGRRLGDLYRWQATNTPGTLHELETAGNAKSYLAANQTLCYPIPRTERLDNKNIPDSPTSG